MTVRKTLTTLLLALFGLHAAYAEVFNVDNAEALRVALLTAESNGENDTINIASGVYTPPETLKYQASGGEAFSLSIVGADSTTTILDGNDRQPVLRIDTRAGDDSPNASVSVTGLTIRNGRTGVASDGNVDGGGLYVLTQAGGVSVTASEFYDNVAQGDGGGVFIRTIGLSEETITLDDLTFQDNSALGEANAGGGGGGAHVETTQFAGVSVTNIDFLNNNATGNGGGLQIEGNDADEPDGIVPAVANVRIFDVLFRGNTISLPDGNGGGADIAASTVQIEQVGFVDNTSAFGGGLYVRNVQDLGVVNTGFAGNEAQRNLSAANGGALAVIAGLGAQVTLTNNTLVDNRATDLGGGAFLEVGGSTGLVNLYNNIFWDNFQEFADLYVDEDPLSDIPAAINLFNNNVVSFSSKCTIEASCTPNISQGSNLSVDPMLLDASLRPDPDIHLGPDSPMIDAGENAAPRLPTLDFEGDARIADGNDDTLAVVDIGMDEGAGGMAPAEIDLALTISDSPDPAVGGTDQITYVVTVTNSAATAATAVALELTLPAGVNFISANASGGICDDNGGTVTCTWQSLAGAASAPATVVVAPLVVTSDTTLTASATVQASETDSDASNNSASTVTTVTAPSVDLVVTIAGPSSDPSVGDTVTYIVTVTNAGPSPESSTTLIVTLPADVTFTSATADRGEGCDESQGDVTCAIGDLAAGASATVTVVGTAPDADATYTVTGMATGVVTDTNATNNSASVDTTVVSTIELRVRAKGGGGATGVFTLWLMLLAGLRRLTHDRKYRAMWVATLGTVVLAVGVHAQGVERYVGSSVGSARANYDEVDLIDDLAARGFAINTVTVDDTDFAWKAYVGLDDTKRFAYELAWVDLGKIESEFGATIAPSQIDELLNATSEVHEFLADGVALSGAWHYPVTDEWRVFVRAGLFFWKGETDVWVLSGGTGRTTFKDDGTGLLIGFGADYRINQRLRARVEWERYDVKDWVDLVTVGVAVSF